MPASVRRLLKENVKFYLSLTMNSASLQSVFENLTIRQLLHMYRCNLFKDNRMILKEVFSYISMRVIFYDAELTSDEKSVYAHYLGTINRVSTEDILLYDYQYEDRYYNQFQYKFTMRPPEYPWPC